MDAFIDFMGAALPWIAIGILLAVIAVRDSAHKKDKEKKEDRGTEGMALGMCLGVAVASAIHVNIGLGMGLFVGSTVEKKED